MIKSFERKVDKSVDKNLNNKRAPIMDKKLIKKKIKEQLIYLYEENNSKVYENFKLKVLQFLKIRDETTFDLLFYLYIKSLNDNRPKIKKILIWAINKLESEFIEDYINDLKKMLPNILEIDQNDATIFLKKIFLIDPAWVYIFLQKRKGLLEKGLYSYYIKIDNNFKKLEYLKQEIELIIKENLKFNDALYINIDYFDDIKYFI